jgi:hypothetical protein
VQGVGSTTLFAKGNIGRKRSLDMMDEDAAVDLTQEVGDTGNSDIDDDEHPHRGKQLKPSKPRGIFAFITLISLCFS